MSIPYYSIQGDWDSTLTLNNSSHIPLAASLTLYSLDGKALQLPDVALQPSENIALRLGELIPRSSNNGRFQEGSVELRFNSSDPMALAPQLAVSDSQHGLSFDMEPPMGLKSSTLEGLWWSPDDKTSGRVMLSNTTADNLHAQLDIEWNGIVIPATGITLAPHQTFVLDVEKLLKGLNISAKGIERGGLSIHHAGAPGALIAQGVVLNKERRFSSGLNFVDPAVQKNSVLNGSGLMLAHPAAGSPFPEGSFFTPQLTLRNAAKTSQAVTVTVNYTANGQTQTKVLPGISLAPHEVRAVDFTRFVAGLRDVSVSGAGLKIEATGATGTLIAALTSIDQSRNTVVDVPLVSRSERSGEGGNHPFRLDETSQSVAYLTNITQKPTRVLVALFYPGGMFTPELMRVGPGATIAVDLLQLRDGQVKDVQGRTLPPNLSGGQVFWRPHEGEAMIGRVVTLDKTANTASNFACPNCCGFEPSRWVGSPDPFDGSIGTSQQMTLYEYDSMCGQFTMGPYQASGIRAVGSDNTSIITVTSTSMVSFVGPGSTNVVYDITYYHSDNISAEDCGTTAVDTQVRCPVTANPPTITSIEPQRGMVGTQIDVIIHGKGLRTTTSINAGSGISVTIDPHFVTETEVDATFTIAANAQDGNRSVIVIADTRQSNSVNFFVQIPTSLRRDSISQLMNQQGGCGATKEVNYTLLDQSGQAIMADVTVEEVFSNFTSSDPSIGAPQPRSPQANAGQLVDVVGYEIPSCPPPFTASLTQTFKVVVGQTTYNLSNSNSISFGRQASGAKFVNIQ